MKTEYLDLEDIQIAYCQHGSGQTLLLLHGNSSSKAIFRRHQLNYFAEFHTIALDFRGHGQSNSQDDRLTIEQISRDIIAFCRNQTIENAFLIGYSDGGNVALLLARDAPELFPRILAISPNYLVSGITDSGLRFIRKIRKFMAFLNNLGFRMKPHMMRFDMMLQDIGISEEELGRVKPYVKILYAENDMVDEQHLKRLAELIPSSELQRVKGSTHLSILNHPEAIKIMKEFLLRLIT